MTKRRKIIREKYFPTGVWYLIKDFLPIWKFPYNKVMKELPKIDETEFFSYRIYSSATQKIRFCKDIIQYKRFNKEKYFITYQIWTEKTPISAYFFESSSLIN